ncbi:hypothetical protein [Kitasatospora sp. NPDC056531]|uniref:hypothetical protein n=1 Tax=Kitasatospora sp. NPDC056531 TaxID=3345856 RepID=UPI0036AE2121
MTPRRVAELTVQPLPNRAPEARRPMSVPDVTVVVAAHDTMPHLTACPDLLVGRTPTAGRLEVVAVDGGSADGGHDCCYALVLREDLGDVAERAGVLDRLHGIAALQQVAVELAGVGEELDDIRARSFAWDVPRLLQDGFLLLDDGLQRRVCEEVGRMIERFGARAVYHRLPVAARVRLELAAAIRPEALRDQIRYEAAHGEPPVVADGRRRYAGYPAFRDARLGLPDGLFLLGEEPLVEAVLPLNPAQQLWRGVVPERLRRGLRRSRVWRRLANSVNGGRG